MESRAKVLGHPAHQMLVTFPIGALGLSVAADVLHAATGARKFADAATLALDFGLMTAAVAAPLGLIDWLAIPRGTRAKRIGSWHALGNAAMLGLFAGSRWLRARGPSPLDAKYLSGMGLALSGVAAWLGGELVVRHGIGVKAMPAGAGEADAALPMSEDVPTLRRVTNGRRMPSYR